MSDNTPVAQAPTGDLIPVFVGCIGGVEQYVCNARDLHAFLEIGKDFTTWIKDRIEKYQFVENQDFGDFSPDLGKNPRGRGRPSSEYQLTLDMAKELSMVENNDKGRMARRYFIECERRALAGAVAREQLPLEVEEACEIRAWRLAEEWRSMGAALLGPHPRPENVETLWMAAGTVKARAKERLVTLSNDMLKKGHGAARVSAWILNWQPPGYSTWNQVSWH
ncbi:antA/AntB antirepressor family protein [Tepidimonas sp. HKU77]|uniref:antA/AntB antirepressor family protein n=1 Tax=Tepidimonas sp. HKU77 TaxID=3414503 RepID=UPI003C7C55E4